MMDETIDMFVEKRSLLTVKQFSKKHQSFSEASLRYLIFNEKTNGFAKCVIRIGRKILIDEVLFFSWIDDCKNNGSSHASQSA